MKKMEKKITSQLSHFNKQKKYKIFQNLKNNGGKMT